MDVPLDVIHGDQRDPTRERQRLGVGNADQQRSDQSRSFGNGDRGEIFEACRGFLEREAHRRHDGAQVLTRGKLRNHAAEAGMRRHLRGDHGGENARAVFDHGCRGLIARGFDAQNTHRL